jgi:chloramphenicol-sensitive protein RarD
LGYLYALKPDAQPVNRHYLSAVATFVVFGFISLPIRALHGYESGQLLYYRVAFALLCLVGIIAGFRRDSLRRTLGQYRAAARPEKRKFVRNMLVGSAFLTINWLAFIYVLNHISVQTGSFSYLLCPIVTTLLGSLLLKEKLHVTQWIALGISATACALIGVDSLYNLSFSLFIATSYALYLITQRILRDYDRIVLLAVQVLLAFGILTALGPSFRGAVPPKGSFTPTSSCSVRCLRCFRCSERLRPQGLPASTLAPSCTSTRSSTLPWPSSTTGNAPRRPSGRPTPSLPYRWWSPTRGTGWDQGGIGRRGRRVRVMDTDCYDDIITLLD